MPTATRTPTATPTPTLDVSDVAAVPDAMTLAAILDAERRVYSYSQTVGVRKDAKVYLKAELSDGLYFAVFAVRGNKWGVVEVIPLEPTPTATPDGAREALR